MDFRLCAMLERLGFEFSEDDQERIVINAIGHREWRTKDCEQLLHPELLRWALDNSLPGGLLRKHIAAQICYIVTEGLAVYDVYEPWISEHADVLKYVARYFSESLRLDKEKAAKPKHVFRDGDWHQTYN